MTQKNYQPDPDKISKAVEKSKSKAEDYLKDPDKSRHLLDEAMKKAKNKEKISGPIADLWDNLKTAFRLLQAYFNKQYTVIPWGSIALVVGAVIYFVSPIDLMPDWIPLAGLVDDAAVLVFVLKQINADLQRFLEWEADQAKPVSDQVIDIKLENK